jgi:hypothetical protein
MGGIEGEGKMVRGDRDVPPRQTPDGSLLHETNDDD